MLKLTFDLVKKNNFSVANLDAVVIAQEPNLASFKKLMRNKISGILEIGEDRVNIKGKTSNGLGETGKKEAIACMASVILHKEQ